jgi:6-phosphogluconolactonase (cycloisomerase 2 family)
MTPGQVGFTGDGDQLIVTTKANGSQLAVFKVRSNGRSSETPVKSPSTTPVPFAFTFALRGLLVVGEAGTSNVSTYRIRDNGTLTPVGTMADAQIALCWIVRIGRPTS